MQLVCSQPAWLPVPVADRSPLTFRLVEEVLELEALAPAWQALLRDSASEEPMLAPDWLLPWWSIYGAGSGRTLRVGLFYEGERLLGLAPLCGRRYWYRPGIPLQRLEFLGSDVDEGDGVCSEYLNVIAAAGREQRVATAFAREVVRGGFGPWHEVVLSALDGEGGMPALLRDAFAELGFPGTTRPLMASPYLKLPDTWEGYLRGTLNRKRRRKVLAAVRDFEAWAGGDWQVERVRSAGDLPRGQAILHELHNHRWQEGEGLSGAFSHRRFAAFHQEYMARLFEQGGLELFWLMAKGRPIAVHYQILANRKVYFYQCGRCLDVPHRVRPGIMLLTVAIQDAIARGLREFDFLGGEARYKRQLTRTTRPLLELRIARQLPREWLRRGVAAICTGVRQLRQRLFVSPTR